MTPAPTPDLTDRLADLFRETGTAHHQAFIRTDGEDPEWPLWYAERLQEQVGRLVGRSFTRSELVYFFVLADKEYARQSPRPDWPVFYADLFVQRCV
jgi:hypothetical protein